MNGNANKESSNRQPGPDPERLKLPHEDWEEAVREALEREKSEEGWPEEDDQEKGSE